MSPSTAQTRDWVELRHARKALEEIREKADLNDVSWAYDVANAALERRNDTTPERRELLCQRCAHDYPVWVAPNELWNRVVRAHGGDGYGDTPEEMERDHFLCPTCFAMLAEERGIAPTAWVLTEEVWYRGKKLRHLLSEEVVAGEPETEIEEVGRQSLASAARFAASVLEDQVASQGREWSPKLAYTAAKYLRENLAAGEPDDEATRLRKALEAAADELQLIADTRASADMLRARNAARFGAEDARAALRSAAAKD